MADFVAYYRVSTQRQGATGLGLGAQRTAVQAFVLSTKGRLLAEFEEIESAGRKLRPTLHQAIQLAQAKRAVLVIAKLDRLARNVSFVSQLLDSGVEFVAADMPHANKLTIHIISAVAEYEREMIGQRTRAALKNAKSRGVRLGNPRVQDQSKRASECAVENANSFAAALMPRILELQRHGAKSFAAIAAELNTQRVPTQRGKRWTAMGVRNVVFRSRRLAVPKKLNG